MSWRQVGLVKAAEDPKLLGAGMTLWPKQREVLAAIEEGPRIHVLACGRRSGKSTMSGLVGAHSCLLRPDLDALVRPGERRYAVAVATNQRQARLIVSTARAVVERSPLLAQFLIGSTEDELRFDLPDGARTAFAAFPCNSRGGRGWPISTLILDEFAHFLSETEGPAVAGQVIAALMPATAQFGDRARIIVSSTPWGSDGEFADLYQRASSGELVDAVAHKATTAEMNPTITPEFLASEEARDPDTFRAEYLAEFEGSGAAYLDFQRFDVADRGELVPEDGHSWIAGLDPAFYSDTFGMAIVGRDHQDPRRMLLGCVRGFHPRRARSFEERAAVETEILDEVIAELRRWGVRRAVTDQHLSRAVADRLTREGIACRVESMAPASKTRVYGELRARLYSGDLEIYNEPDLIGELRRLRRVVKPGSAQVVSPRVGKSHGDLAQALALVVDDEARRLGESHGVRSGRESLTAGLRDSEAGRAFRSLRRMGG
jgi:hypothetical protein